MASEEQVAPVRGTLPRLRIGRELQNVLILIAVYKVGYLVLMRLSSMVLPRIYDWHMYQENPYYHPPSPASFTMWQLVAWDSAMYLSIGQFGYPAHGHQLAMYPLWPFLIYIFAKVTSLNIVLAGTLLANIISGIAFVVLYQYLREKFDQRIAFRSMVLLLAFPGAIFFAFPYTEPLFLLLVATAFLQLHRDRPWAAGIAAYFCALCRPTGIFMAVPLMVEAWKHKQFQKLPFALMPVAGAATYFAIMRLVAGDAFAGFKAQDLFPTHASITDLLHPDLFFNALLAPWDPHDIHTPQNSPFDRAWFLLTVPLLVRLYRGDKTLFWYTALMVIIPVVTIKFMSYTRYVELGFPLFVAAAGLSTKSRGDWWFSPLVAALFGLQMLFLLRQLNFWWVG